MFFSLYPTSVIAIGYAKACISDIGDARFVQIPIDMANFVQNHKQFNIDEEVSKLNTDETEAVKSYINMLTKYHFGMLSKFLPMMSYSLGTFRKPFPIDSLIIDSDSEQRVFDTLNYLPHDTMSRFVQIRLFFAPTIEFLNIVGNELVEHNMLNVELVFNKEESINFDDYGVIIRNFPFHILRLIVMGCGCDSRSNAQLILVRNELKSPEECGKVGRDLFCINIDTEQKYRCSHNSCLYRKLSIDREGYIRNCPASPQHFGRVGEVSLAEAMAHPDFSRLWGITKDQVEVCRHCEFRRICPDCRVFTRHPERFTAHPVRCTYNPYIASWQGQPGYVPVEQCGEFTTEGFVPDAERIEQYAMKFC